MQYRPAVTPRGHQSRTPQQPEMLVVRGMQPLGALAGGLAASWSGLAASRVIGGGLRLMASVLAIRPLREWRDWRERAAGR